MRSLLLAVVLAVVGGRTIHAQSPYTDQIQSTVALRLTAAPVPVHVTVPAVQEVRTANDGKMLLIFGAALLATGAIVDGDGGTILMVGGVGVGAYGFYLLFAH